MEENPSPPLGICYVAAALEALGNEVVILDYIVRKYSPEKMRVELDAEQPDIIGTNSVTMNFPVAADILRMAKAHVPSAITMMGGPHVTFDAENTLRDYPEIDLVVLGEAEQTLAELMPVIGEPDAWKSIDGIGFRVDGKVVVTDKREFIRELDALPVPARHLLPMSRYQALGFPVSIITSRGCPGRCIFCQGRAMVGKKVRYRSPTLVVDEIEEILSYGIDRINIADDYFTSSKKRVRLLCDEILRRGIRFGWSAFVRADSLAVESLEIMKQAGCDTVSFGIESGNPEMLKRVKKGISLDQVRRAVDRCRQVGMKVFASFMVGLPGESHQTLADSHAFAQELGIDYGYHFLAPFPGTAVREAIEEFDLQILTDDWSRYDANRAIVRTSQLSPREIEAFVELYNEVCRNALDAIHERYRMGTASEAEAMRVIGTKRMNLIFKLLSGDIVDELETFSPKNTELDDRRAFYSAVSRSVDVDEPFVGFVLEDLINKGYLANQKQGDKVRWMWTYSLKKAC